ncbi:hypothetical protein D3C71_1383300 [compost metagenome]
MPVTARQRSATERCTAMPPPMVRRRREKSRRAKSGLFSKALNSVFTPVKAENGTLLISLIRPGMSRGLMMRRLLAPIFMKVRQFAVSAKM